MDNAPRDRLPWILLALLVFLLFAERPGSWLFDPDEARYAAIPQEMILRGDFVTPRLNGTRYLEKPPLLYWLNALSLKTFGHSPYAARLATRLSTLAIVAMLIGFRRRDRSAPLDPWPGIVYLTTPLGFLLGRFNITDGLLTAALTLTFISLYRFIEQQEQGQAGTAMALLSAAGMALAVLSKGLIGLLLPGVVFVFWVAAMKRWNILLRWAISPAPLLFLIMTAPWFITVSLKNPGFAYFFFIREHFLRYATQAASRPGPIFYYAVVFLAGFLPWTLLFGRSLWRQIPWSPTQWRRHPEELFLALWFFVIFAFFSVSKSKLIPYILPACPAAALMVAMMISSNEAWPKGGRWLYAGFLSLAVLLGLILGSNGGWFTRYGVTGYAWGAGVLALAGAWSAVLIRRRTSGIMLLSLSWIGLYSLAVAALPRVSPDLSAHQMAVAAARQPGAEVVFYHCFSQSFPWTLQRPVPLVGDRYDELQIEWGKPDSLFWSEEEFWRRWNSSSRIIVLSKKEWRNQFDVAGRKAPHPLGNNRRYDLLSNFQPS